MLGYSKWDNFINAISKAKISCQVAKGKVSDHFADIKKMVDLGSGSQREVEDIKAKDFVSENNHFQYVVLIPEIPHFVRDDTKFCHPERSEGSRE